jgi:hypothetical protein
MSKPYGLTSLLEVTRPTKSMDMIWDAVEQARLEGMTPRQIKMEMQDAWEHACKEEAKLGGEFTR